MNSPSHNHWGKSTGVTGVSTSQNTPTPSYTPLGVTGGGWGGVPFSTGEKWGAPD